MRAFSIAVVFTSRMTTFRQNVMCSSETMCYRAIAKVFNVLYSLRVTGPFKTMIIQYDIYLQKNLPLMNRQSSETIL